MVGLLERRRRVLKLVKYRCRDKIGVSKLLAGWPPGCPLGAIAPLVRRMVR
jgi:hypothetical protein